MKVLIFALFAISSTVVVDAVITEIYRSRISSSVASSRPIGVGDEKKVICVYNSTSSTREGE